MSPCLTVHHSVYLYVILRGLLLSCQWQVLEQAWSPGPLQPPASRFPAHLEGVGCPVPLNCFFTSGLLSSVFDLRARGNVLTKVDPDISLFLFPI